ncbi:hypothetical protein ACLUPT_37385, partial (plasmid) [Variovorax sp. SCN45]
GESLRNAGEWEAKRDASCMVFLLNKKAVEENRTPDSKIRSPAFRLFGAVGARNPVGPVATVFPEFIARDERERADGGRQGNKRRVGRPAGAAEDTALRALTAHGRGLQSRTR